MTQSITLVCDQNHPTDPLTQGLDLDLCVVCFRRVRSLATQTEVVPPSSRQITYFYCRDHTDHYWKWPCLTVLPATPLFPPEYPSPAQVACWTTSSGVARGLLGPGQCDPAPTPPGTVSPRLGPSPTPEAGPAEAAAQPGPRLLRLPITWTLQMAHVSHSTSQLHMATAFHFLEREHFCHRPTLDPALPEWGQGTGFLTVFHVGHSGGAEPATETLGRGRRAAMAAQWGVRTGHSAAPQATGRRGGLGPWGARDWLARPSDVTVRRHQRLPGVLVPGTRVPNARPAQRGEGPRADPARGRHVSCLCLQGYRF